MALTINDIPDLTPPPKGPKEDTAYAAILAGGNPREDYLAAQAEIAQTGESILVNNEKRKWAEEQTKTYNKTTDEILMDSSIPEEVRVKVAQQYMAGGGPTIKSLRSKVQQLVATREYSSSPVDQESQTKFTDSLFAREDKAQKADQASSIVAGIDKLKESDITFASVVGESADTAVALGQVVLSLGTKAVLTVPAGIAAGYALMTTKDSELAAGVVEGILTDTSYATKTEQAQAMEKTVGRWLQKLEYPFVWAGDKVYAATLMALAVEKEKQRKAGTLRPGFDEAGDQFASVLASGVYAGGNVFGYTGAAIGVAKATSKGVQVYSKSTTVKPDAPIAAVATASRDTAAKAAAAAVVDETGAGAEMMGATKPELVATYGLSKIEADGDILPDIRAEITRLDKDAQGLFDQTEFNAHIDNVDKIVAERKVYTAVMAEMEPYLLLSSSALDIDTSAQLFGRFGKDYESFVTSGVEGLGGTAVFGRNSNFGWATKEQASEFILDLQAKTADLPDPGTFKLLEKDGQNYIQWDFKTKLIPHEMVSFGPDSIKASFLGMDVTRFANTTPGSWFFPPATRLDGKLVAGSVATFLKEGQLEARFIQAQRDLFTGTKHPKELTAMVDRASASGIKQELIDFQQANTHLTKSENQQLYSEYMGFRRIQEHLYRFADRSYVKRLNENHMQSLYNAEGALITHATKPVTRETLAKVTKIWDIQNKKTVDLPDTGDIVQLNTAIKDGSHVLRFAIVDPKMQFGAVRPGALNQIPEYVARRYKERFVVERVSQEMYLDGTKVPSKDLFKYDESIAMAKTQKDADKIVARFAAEEPNAIFKVRKEEKDIADAIINDSKIYDSHQSAIHKRGDKLPSLEGDAEVLDFLTSQTKSIRSMAKVTAWEDVVKARKEAWTKAFSGYTKDGMFPNQSSGIVPKGKMGKVEEREFLAAQSTYKQMEREQLSNMPSDEIWKGLLHTVADGFDKINLPQEVLREWGDKGLIPLRATKALASNLYIHQRPLRQWAVQTQQLADLAFISPSFLPTIMSGEIGALTMGLITNRGPLSALSNGMKALGNRASKEYSTELAAMERTGITQGIDMNSYIHGMLKDTTESLVPPKVTSVLGAVDKVVGTTTAALSLPGKIARKIGFDPAELTAQVGLWKFAKHRWQEQNPGKNWNTPNAEAEIHQSQILLGNTPSTRSGMMPWQDGMISALGQFMGQPHRSLMQMFSSKELTGTEKAQLAAGRMVWYGIYGAPYGAQMGAFLERQATSDEQRKIIQQGGVGLNNLIFNGAVSVMFGDTNSAWGKSLSTVPEKVFAHDMLVTLFQIGKGEKPNLSIAPIKATGQVFDTVTTLKDIFTVGKAGIIAKEDWTKAVWKTVSFAVGFTDFEKAMLIQNMNKAGKDSGYSQTTGEAIARLWGIPPTQEVLDRMVMSSQIDRSKHVKDRAADIHGRLVRLEKVTGVEGWKAQTDYWESLRAFNSVTDPAYAEEVMTAVLVLDKKRAGDGKDSLVLNIFNKAGDKYDAYVTDMINSYEKSTDPEVMTFIKDLKVEQEKNRQFMRGTK